MSHTGEFDLIAGISARFEAPAGVAGIGDDCAVIPQRDGLDTLVTTDLLIEDRHFLLGDITPEQLGWKSAAVNISDIAAMGGTPSSAFLSIALPPRIGPEWVDGFITGFKAIADRYGVPLLGGDTSASPDKLFINVVVLGSCAHGAARKRSDALPGDLVCVTGTLGDSAAGLRLVLERQKGSIAGIPLAEQEFLLNRHYLPEPRVQEGLLLAATPGVHAMMDLSDGMASDLRHILKASGVGADIGMAALPLSHQLQAVCASRGWDAADLAVSGGEDYELLFTMAPATLVPATVPYTVVGRITEVPGLRWHGGSRDDYQGFTHF